MRYVGAAPTRRLIEDASDPFRCFPSPIDVDILERGFRAARQIYRAAAQCAEEELRSRTLVTAESLASLASFGDGAQSIYAYYQQKGYTERNRVSGYAAVSPGDFDEYVGLPPAYEPWYDIGLPLPFDTVDLALDVERGVETLRCGDLGPLTIDVSGEMPDIPDTVLVRRCFSGVGYEAIFTGLSFARDDGEPSEPNGQCAAWA